MRWNNVIKTKAGIHVYIDTAYTFDAGWETMVFECDENGMVSDWLDLDVKHYGCEEMAGLGHSGMVEKWENLTAEEVSEFINERDNLFAD